MACAIEFPLGNLNEGETKREIGAYIYLQNDIRNLNQTDELQGLLIHLDQVTNWVNNSSEKV
jgi:hypothetical protein